MNVNELRKMAKRDNVNAQVALGDYYYNSQNYNEAIKWYRKATTKGNAEAAYRLGLCYEKGHGVQKDNKTALLWYNTAAKQGNQEAQKRLNEINKQSQQNNEIADLMQEAEKGNATARNELRKMAERDNVNAQVALGDYYYNSQNYNEAVRWYRRATTKGNAEAAYRLGLCYEKGHGVQKDNKTALLWYNTAAKQGNQEAQKRLNEINKQSQQNNEITDLIHKAQAGDVDAQYDLGNRYLNGDGVEQDVEKASYWFQQNTANTKKTQNNNASASYAAMYNSEKTTQQNNEITDLQQKAAEQGDSCAQYNLGYCYEYGQGVEQNYYEAVYWYKKAAEQGYARAQCNLGYCFQYGQGVKQNYYDAVYWYRKATEQGNVNAKIKLRKMAERDNVNAQVTLGDYYYNSQNYNEAVRWYRKAATRNAEAAYRLGLCYEKGHGIQKDNKTALFWYNTAAKQGNQEAQKRLNEINKQSQQNSANTKKTQNNNASASYTTYYNEKPTQQNNEITDLQQKAQTGNADAQDSLGDCYFYGRGVKQDFEEAVKWYKKAAEQDNGVAQRNLGNCYVLGAGVPKDFEKAKMWHDKAKENGEEYDRKLLEEMEEAFNP